MESLDEMLAAIAPDIEPQRSLVKPVLKAITAERRRVSRWRRVYGGLVAAAGIATIAALLRGNSAHVLWLGVSKFSAVWHNSGLYAKALAEALPWPALGLLAAAAAGGWFLMNLEKRAHFASAMVGLCLALSLGATSASAYAAVNPSTEPGPAEQQLERTLNGIGHETVTLNGQTYELGSGSGLSDDQIRAMAEWQELLDATASIPAQKATDGGTSLCACKVINMTSSQLAYDWWYSYGQSVAPKPLAVTSKTRFFIGSKPSAPFMLQPGDQVVTEPSPDGSFAAVIEKPGYPFDDYAAVGGFSRTQAKHGQNGKCYNYPQAACPDLPSVYDFMAYMAPESDVPQGAEIRELYGTLTSIGNYSFTLKDSTGAEWTIWDGGSLSGLNSAGIYVNGGVDHSLVVQPGDHLRIEFWQYENDLNGRVIHDGEVIGYPGATKDQARQLMAAGKFQQAPFQLRSLQLALKKPWTPGMPADKY